MQVAKWGNSLAVRLPADLVRELGLKEGDQMVVILPDHGTRYLGKVYNDDWMRNHGFLEDKSYATARDIISKRPSDYSLIAVKKSDAVREAIALMNKTSVSQIPVLDGGEVV